MKLKLVDVISEADQLKWVDRLLNGVRKSIVSTLDKTGESMVKHAVDGHRYKNRTYKAQNSISYSVTNPAPFIVSMSFYIDPSEVTTKDGYNYAWIQNDGSYAGYHRGYMSPTAQTVGPKAKGIQHDDYMGRAWLSNLPRYEKKIDNILKRLK